MDNLTQNLKQELEKAIEHFHGEIASLRTGRATPALVENLPVEAYGGQKMPLSQIASISVAPPSAIVIQPWDKSVVQAIEKAVQNSSLGLSPVSEGEVVRLNLPQLTEEKRAQLIKLAKQKLEEARIAIRKNRENVLDEVKKMEKDKQISEDEKFNKKDEIQKIVDEYNKKAEEMFKKKEEEIARV